jgi:hypothetical protein
MHSKILFTDNCFAMLKYYVKLTIKQCMNKKIKSTLEKHNIL